VVFHGGYLNLPIRGAVSPIDVKVMGMPPLWDAVGEETNSQLRISTPRVSSGFDLTDLGVYTIIITVTDHRGCSARITVIIDFRGGFGRARTVRH